MAFQSVWENIKKKTYDKLEKNIECEILIIGGGIAGILTAYILAERGHAVTLVEASQILGGTTANTTATITAQHGLIYSEIAKKYSYESAKLFYESQQSAVNEYQKMIEKHNIDCDFSILNGFIYSSGNADKLKKEYLILRKIDAEASYIEKLDGINLKVKGAIKQMGQAQFDPLKFLSSLPVKYNIYENSRIVDIDFAKKVAYTVGAKIEAKKIIVATHFPIFNFPLLTFTKQYQSMSYAMAFKGAEKVSAIYNDDKEDGFTVRQHKDFLIVGGCDHRTGRKNKNDCFTALEVFAKKIFTECREHSRWVSEDCATFDDMPFIGKVNENDDSGFVITGFNKWGMANAMTGANLIADIIENKENKYENIFSPRRKYIGNNIMDFMKNIGTTSVNLLKSLFYFPFKNLNKLKKGRGDIFIIDGKKCAAYRDENNKLYILPALCTHLKCQLQFNQEAKSWDCPCHGSRFNIFGDILTEPTVKRLDEDEVL